jgi:nucleotide-binding universal stress UspA family protein
LAREQNIPCDALAREGHPVQQIAIAARQFQADRVLLGTRSRSKLGKLLLGSVAEQVLRSVNLPVITVGPEAHLPVESSSRDRVVLHATTLRETSRPSAALACHIAASQGARLVLLHVLPPMDEPSSDATGRSGQPSSLDSAALHELRILAAETASDCGTAVEPHVVHGNPSIEILAEASELRASLIVLGATHRSAFENLTRDRTVYRVLAHARCPVLTLRERESNSAAPKTEQLATHY